MYASVPDYNFEYWMCTCNNWSTKFNVQIHRTVRNTFWSIVYSEIQCSLPLLFNILWIREKYHWE